MIAVVGQHGMHTGVGRFHNTIDDALVVIRSGHAADQPLNVTEIVIGGKNQVVGVGSAVSGGGVGGEVQETAAIEGKVGCH